MTTERGTLPSAAGPGASTPHQAPGPTKTAVPAYGSTVLSAAPLASHDHEWAGAVKTAGQADGRDPALPGPPPDGAVGPRREGDGAKRSGAAETRKAGVEPGRVNRRPRPRRLAALLAALALLACTAADCDGFTEPDTSGMAPTTAVQP